jgi:hypothetical protein
LEELAFGQEDDVAHFLVKTDDGRGFADHWPHPLREVGTQRVQLIAECIVEEFGEPDIFALNLQLLPKVGIGNMDYGLFFPYLRAKEPAIDDLFRREPFVTAFAIDRLQEPQGKGRERAETTVPDNLLACHFLSLVLIDGLNATGGKDCSDPNQDAEGQTP